MHSDHDHFESVDETGIGLMRWVFISLFVAFALFAVGSCQKANASDILSIARSEIGNGEIGGDNKGKYVKQYTRGRECAWCAGFVSWVMTKAGVMDNRYYTSAREFWNQYGRVSKPRPGDVVCFWRVSKKSRYGHVGIVETISGNKITTIEGNTGKYPSKVCRKTYELGKIDNLLGFVRIK